MTEPSPLQAAAKMLADARATAASLASSHAATPIEIDTPLSRRWARAEERRKAVHRMSLDGKTVASIAAALGVSYGYVVKLRGRTGVGRVR